MLTSTRHTGAVHRTLTRVATRSLHTSAPRHYEPKPKVTDRYIPKPLKPSKGMETLAQYWQLERTNTNVDNNTNFNITVGLLKKLYQANKNQNICVSPLSVCLALQGDAQFQKLLSTLNIDSTTASNYQNTDYQAIYDTIVKVSDGTVRLTQQVAAPKESLEASAEVVKSKYLYTPESGRTVVPTYPLPSSSSLPKIDDFKPSLQNLLNFTGYWAPNFVVHDTRLPSVFTNLNGTKSITYMLQKTSKMWYTETEEYQMIDVPYMNHNFVATVVIPRITDDHTILFHPQLGAYNRIPKRPSSVTQILDRFAANPQLFTSNLKAMQLLPGQLYIPSFHSDYTFDNNLVGIQSNISHRAALTVGIEGLD